MENGVAFQNLFQTGASAARRPAWFLLGGLTVVACGAAGTLPPWAFMWALAFAIFAGCNWLMWGSANLAKAPWTRSLAYLFLWPGMDARPFLDGRRHSRRALPAEWLFAGTKTLFGASLLWGLVRMIPAACPLVRGWVGMTGLIFILHFGLFHLLALLWQRLGIAVRPLMHWPIAARSLGDFWGERWNRGFNDIAVRHIFKPLWPRFGVMTATLAAFLVSGVIHDFVITVPARGGWGLPTLYFLIQGLGVLFERSRFGKSLGLRKGLRGWLFTMGVVAGPVGLLFPVVFVGRVMLPFFQFVGAL